MQKYLNLLTNNSWNYYFARKNTDEVDLLYIIRNIIWFCWNNLGTVRTMTDVASTVIVGVLAVLKLLAASSPSPLLNHVRNKTQFTFAFAGRWWFKPDTEEEEILQQGQRESYNES